MAKFIDKKILEFKKVIIRVDFNVPLLNGIVQDDFRIRKSIPIIQYCLDSNASVVLISHMGRPNGEKKQSMSLSKIKTELEGLLNLEILFSDDCISDDAINTSKGLLPGQVHLLENLRFYNEEVLNDRDFSLMLSKHGDVFINEAFGTAHRSHASNVGICSFMKYKFNGLLMNDEYQFLYEGLKKPEHPYTLILGGAKVSGKIELISSMMDKVDNILIGGAMAFTFLKAKGVDIGDSFYEIDNIDVATNILHECIRKNIDIHLPKDVVVSDEIGNIKNAFDCNIISIPGKMKGFDIGGSTCDYFKSILKDSKLIVWNGPLGVAEVKRYSNGTKTIADFIGSLHDDHVTTIIGGGDTSSAVKRLSPNSVFSHVSTGGGSSLELLSGNELPAFKAINSQERINIS